MCSSRKDWRYTPIKTRPTRPTRMEFYPDRLGMYARELDKYVNRLERDAEKESKKRSAALKKELDVHGIDHRVFVEKCEFVAALISAREQIGRAHV